MGNYLFALAFILLGLYLILKKRFPVWGEVKGVAKPELYLFVNGVGLVGIGLLLGLGTYLGWPTLWIGCGIVIGCVLILIAEVFLRCI